MPSPFRRSQDGEAATKPQCNAVALVEAARLFGRSALLSQHCKIQIDELPNLRGARQLAYSYVTMSTQSKLCTKRCKSEWTARKHQGPFERVGDGAIGSTAAFEAVNLGSSPSPRATMQNKDRVRLQVNSKSFVCFRAGTRTRI